MPLHSYLEWQPGSLPGAQKKKSSDDDCVKCPKCKNTWFEQIKAMQLKVDHNVVIGQEVPVNPNSNVPFVLLRCVKCGELTEPRLFRNTFDQLNKKYDEFLDSLEEQPAEEVLKVDKL
jgi:hypothetical protein